MPKTAVPRLQSFSLAIRHLLPAWLAFTLAAPVQHPLTFVLLLIGNALAMTGICHALGLDMESSFGRSIARRGLAYFVLLTAYAAIVAALLAGPAWWLARDGSLPAALALSIALVVALFALWRLWPAFALPLHLGRRVSERRTRLLAARRAASIARVRAPSHRRARYVFRLRPAERSRAPRDRRRRARTRRASAAICRANSASPRSRSTP